MESRSVLAAAWLCAVFTATSARAAEPTTTTTTTTTAAATATVPVEHRSPKLQGSLRYDAEYPAIGYSEAATHNAVARLQERMERGEVKLEFNPVRGYVDSLLKNLGIDPTSQLLVYSKSSLQIDWIRAATPRAIYYNEESSVAWEKGAPLVEIMAMDSQLGPVFYSLPNRQAGGQGLDREGSRCLICHDRFGLMGGGVPNFLANSSLVDTNGLTLQPDDTVVVTDQTPLESRWGGWYVSGQPTSQKHLGNIMIHGAGELTDLARVQRGTLQSLDDLFDTRAYLTNKSDIVALLVLEHQNTVYNLITRLNFKARTVLTAESALTPVGQRILRSLSEPLLKAMLFINAAPLTSKIAGSSGFDRWLQAQGPHDATGRSLRDLDLTTRLFKYPLSYLIYSAAFDGLPQYVKETLYRRFAEILAGQDRSGAYAQLGAADRQAVMQILAATLPEMNPYWPTSSSPPASLPVSPSPPM